MEPNYKLCMEEHLIILKMLLDLNVTFEKNQKYIGTSITNDLPSIFPKQWWSHYFLVGLKITIDLTPFDLKTSTVFFITNNIFPDFENYLKSNQVQKTKWNHTFDGFELI